jgi:hypothetical protein
MLARLATLAAVLLAGAGVPANAQSRDNFVPNIAVPPVSHVTIAPTTAPTVTPAPPPSIGPAPVTDSSQTTSRVVGTQPDPSVVLPNSRLMQQQSRGSDHDDNFLTEDWGRGRNRYGARVGSPNKRVDTPPRKRIDTPPSGGPTNPGLGATVTSMQREVLIFIDGTKTEAQILALSQRHRLARIESFSIPLLAGTVFRWRVPDNRSLDRVVSELSIDSDVRLAQENRVYRAQDAGTKAPAEGDAGQYALAKLHLPEAHVLARGTDVAIAVIDSGIDVTHSELAGAVIGTYDALNSKEGAHPHGTGVAGTIVAHSRLVGSAPAARILAIRAFAANPQNGAESTSFVVLKALNYAAQQNAQIINMSFAGPADPLVQQALAASFARGIVLVAAAGNAGPNSPPLYPAADSHVIAVTATDSGDRLFAAANRGAYVAIAAPGVDILMPAPEDKYQVNSGTSFAAAYVSGLAALLIDRNPGITPDGIRTALTATAHDLGPRGRDDQFGAGLADAMAAVEAVSRSVSAGAAKTEAVPAAVPAR